MRDLNECKAEVFRRSDKRRRELRRNRERVLAMCLSLCLTLTVLAVMHLPEREGPVDGKNELPETRIPEDDHDELNEEKIPIDRKMPENVSFSLTWDIYGRSSYDSATAKLVKTADAANPEDRVAILHLNEAQRAEIWQLLCKLNIETYPEEYDPHGGTLRSDSTMTLILTLRDGDSVKTVLAKDIAALDSSDDPKGQVFLDVCKAIRDMLTATEEWKALSENEIFHN